MQVVCRLHSSCNQIDVTPVVTVNGVRYTISSLSVCSTISPERKMLYLWINLSECLACTTYIQPFAAGVT